MKKFLLMMFLFIAILYVISFTINFFFEFEFINIVFVIGIIACFFTYGGRVSSLGEAYASITTWGHYVPNTRINKNISSLDPFFIGSLLTAISAFILLFL